VNECKPDELELKASLLEGYETIRNNPFQPHAVARTRQLAYQFCVVMKYLDNLIAWGDSLFQQDTVETINEATQIYILAANICGRKPQRIPRTGTVRPKTYAELREKSLDELGNALVDLESQFPLSIGAPQLTGPDPDGPEPLFGIGRTLYFCVPHNEKLLAYWDTIADRLFKIRHCMNISGIVRQLALFDPPIDPGMLVKAAAAGLDVSAAVNGINQPLSPVRAQVLIQKALELCGEVRGLGAALLAAVEKGDAERLALIRQGHEKKVLQMLQEVRNLQWRQAQQSTRALLDSRHAPLQRLAHYKRLLGLPDDANASGVEALQFKELTEANFDATFADLVSKYDKAIAPQSYAPLKLSSEGRARMYLTDGEDGEFTHLASAREIGFAASVSNTLAAGFAPVPDATVNLHFWGLGGAVKLNVGTALVAGAKIAGDVLGIIASWEREKAGMSSRTATYERRADEWVLQHNSAAEELRQVGRQVLVSLIAEQMAHHEFETIKQQVTHIEELDQHMAGKFSNEQLHLWMQGELSRLYYEYYRYAVDTARKAERAMKHELMRSELDATDFVKFNYWDGGRKGLLAGETLHLDVKRMELAYLENNRREYELTRHLSIRQLDPLALLSLKVTGRCEINVPEWVFDLDSPGHYMRRIKSVALTLPAIAGPNTSVSCTLTLLRSSIRKTADLGDQYARGEEDGRFVDYLGNTQSIVTSSAQLDSGVFENGAGDRPMPFEGAGAISTWRLELPTAFRSFDYDTLADAVLHIQMTSREGGEPLRKGAVEGLQSQLETANDSGLALFLSLRHDFPDAWHQRGTLPTTPFKATLTRAHFPYFTVGSRISLEKLRLYKIEGDKLTSTEPVGLNYPALSTQLADNEACELSLTGVGPEARYALIAYSLQ
jgi:hypothetical protein